MVESIFTKSGVPAPGTIAKLKVGKPVTVQSSTSMTSAENRLADILDLSPEATKKVQSGRKVDAYLRMFNSVMQFINRSYKINAPQISPVTIEYVKLENPYLKKTDGK